jgi:hypothetical protein
MMAGQYEKAFTGHYGQIAHAATGAIKEAADLAKSAARANIAGAGFSGRWQNALRANTYPKTGESVDAAAFIYHKIDYAGIFEHGGAISGKPLLWLPIGKNLPGGNRQSPAKYAAAHGGLKVVKQGGKVFLVGKVGRKTVPLFVGVSTVTMPKKFDVITTVKKVAAKLPELYSKNLKG